MSAILHASFFPNDDSRWRWLIEASHPKVPRKLAGRSSREVFFTMHHQISLINILRSNLNRYTVFHRSRTPRTIATKTMGNPHSKAHEHDQHVTSRASEEVYSSCDSTASFTTFVASHEQDGVLPDPTRTSKNNETAISQPTTQLSQSPIFHPETTFEDCLPGRPAQGGLPTHKDIASGSASSEGGAVAHSRQFVSCNNQSTIPPPRISRAGSAPWLADPGRDRRRSSKDSKAHPISGLASEPVLVEDAAPVTATLDQPSPDSENLDHDSELLSAPLQQSQSSDSSDERPRRTRNPSRLGALRRNEIIDDRDLASIKPPYRDDSGNTSRIREEYPSAYRTYLEGSLDESELDIVRAGRVLSPVMGRRLSSTTGRSLCTCYHCDVYPYALKLTEYSLSRTTLSSFERYLSSSSWRSCIQLR
jgi:hypothetical protein